MPPADYQERKLALSGEALLCGLLGKILYQSPDRAWLQSLISDDVFAESPFGMDQAEVQRGLELLQRWTAESRGGISDAEFADLQAEHLRLFVGIDQMLAPPWESVYFNESRLTFREETLQVREWYARFGLQIEHLHREPDDHIGLEISFIAHLASRAVQAINDGDLSSAEQLLQGQRDFLSEHLLRWGPAWAKLVKKQTQTDFYQGLAHLTHGALLALAQELEIPMPKEVAL